MHTSQAKTFRVGVDVGGTFTDMVVVDSSGGISVYKVPTVPEDPARGVFAAVELAASRERLDVGQFLARVDLFAHGSTIATNTVLEAKGARVGLITTAGFRDAIEIRRGERDNPWDHRTPYAPVLVPRYLRQPVRGRLDRDGREFEPLVEDDVATAAAVVRVEGGQSVAGFQFNSYVNSTHESRVAELVRAALPDVAVTESAKVASIVGEYERGSTAVLDAYVKPRTVGYLRTLNRRLTELGLRVALLLIQNNGGAISVDQIADRPAALLLSGPAAGVGALQYYGQAIGTHDLISMEIGGTSCDVIVMSGGKVAFSDRLDIGGYTCVLPAVEIHTIGAGGGTIARADEAGLIHVGPAGAGARPGPACYGLGGEEPTITDAQLMLGRIKPGPMAGGSVTLDPDRAARAIEERIAKPLGLSVEQAAAGIIRLMDQKLLHAVQRLSSERGHDPRRLTLVGAGGAGPLHGAVVGRSLGCARVFLPRLAGTFCALGMLHSDVRHDYARVHFADLEQIEPERMGLVFAELEQEAVQTLVEEGFGPGERELLRYLDLRYIGQQWDITIPIDAAFNPQKIRSDFEQQHDRLFGHIQPAGTIEITKVRLAGVGRLPPLTHERLAAAENETPEPSGSRPVWLGQDIGWRETPVFAAGSLRPGHSAEGPLVVDELTTTVFVPPGDRLQVHATGSYLIHFERSAP